MPISMNAVQFRENMEALRRDQEQAYRTGDIETIRRAEEWLSRVKQSAPQALFDIEEAARYAAKTGKAGAEELFGLTDAGFKKRLHDSGISTDQYENRAFAESWMLQDKRSRQAGMLLAQAHGRGVDSFTDSQRVTYSLLARLSKSTPDLDDRIYRFAQTQGASILADFKGGVGASPDKNPLAVSQAADVANMVFSAAGGDGALAEGLYGMLKETLAGKTEFNDPALRAGRMQTMARAVAKFSEVKPDALAVARTHWDVDPAVKASFMDRPTETLGALLDYDEALRKINVTAAVSLGKGGVMAPNGQVISQAKKALVKQLKATLGSPSGTASTSIDEQAGELEQLRNQQELSRAIGEYHAGKHGEDKSKVVAAAYRYQLSLNKGDRTKAIKLTNAQLGTTLDEAGAEALLGGAAPEDVAKEETRIFAEFEKKAPGITTMNEADQASLTAAEKAKALGSLAAAEEKQAKVLRGRRAWLDAAKVTAQLQFRMLRGKTLSEMAKEKVTIAGREVSVADLASEDASFGDALVGLTESTGPGSFWRRFGWITPRGTTTDDVKTALSGSLDRPRMMLALRRAGMKTQAAASVPGGQAMLVKTVRITDPETSEVLEIPVNLADGSNDKLEITAAHYADLAPTKDTAWKTAMTDGLVKLIRNRAQVAAGELEDVEAQIASATIPPYEEPILNENQLENNKERRADREAKQRTSKMFSDKADTLTGHKVTLLKAIPEGGMPSPELKAELDELQKRIDAANAGAAAFFVP